MVEKVDKCTELDSRKQSCNKLLRLDIYTDPVSMQTVIEWVVEDWMVTQVNM